MKFDIKAIPQGNRAVAKPISVRSACRIRSRKTSASPARSFPKIQAEQALHQQQAESFAKPLDELYDALKKHREAAKPLSEKSKTLQTQLAAAEKKHTEAQAALAKLQASLTGQKRGRQSSRRSRASKRTSPLKNCPMTKPLPNRARAITSPIASLGQSSRRGAKTVRSGSRRRENGGNRTRRRQEAIARNANRTGEGGIAHQADRSRLSSRSRARKNPRSWLPKPPGGKSTG